MRGSESITRPTHMFAFPFENECAWGSGRGGRGPLYSDKPRQHRAVPLHRDAVVPREGTEFGFLASRIVFVRGTAVRDGVGAAVRVDFPREGGGTGARP